MNIGRIEIFTDAPAVTAENIIPILQKAMPKHMQNAARCSFLLNYEAGNQPLQREKTFRKDINIHAVDNVANEITEFKLAFNHGNPIALIQRGEKDSGGSDESEAVTLLNECYEAAGGGALSQKLFRFVEICGIGYSYIGINSEYEDGDSYFTYNVLDPRNAFIIRSSYYLDHRPMVGVSFRKDEIGNVHFSCFTKYRRFEILNLTKFENEKIIKESDSSRDWEAEGRWEEKDRSNEKNLLERIPVVEWIRSEDRIGCFERQISEMDNLNILVSDFSNDVDQNTQAIFHANDIDFPKDKDGEETHPKTNDWVVTQTTQDGKTPFITPLSVQYDYPGMLSNIQYRRSTILQKCNVPLRSNNVSNATGIAISDSSGWTNAENEANKQDRIKYGCKMEEVKIALAAIKKSPFIESGNKLLELRFSDVKPSINRQKNFELAAKSSTLANLLGHGIYGLHALNTVNLFEDVATVWNDSKSLIEKYQSSLFDKQPEPKEENPQSTDGGYEVQTSNSPRIDGISKQNPKDAEPGGDDG